MTKRYRVTMPWNFNAGGEEKTKWIDLGTAFENDNGSIVLYLHAMPASTTDREGRPVYKMTLFEANRDGKGRP